MTAVRTLTVQIDNFDQVNTFEVNAGKRYPMRASLHKFNDPRCKEFEILSSGSCLKDSYTDKDRAESARLAAETPLNHGDTVSVEGKLYTVRVRGAYCDCAYLIAQ